MYWNICNIDMFNWLTGCEHVRFIFFLNRADKGFIDSALCYGWVEGSVTIETFSGIFQESQRRKTNAFPVYIIYMQHLYLYIYFFIIIFKCINIELVAISRL